MAKLTNLTDRELLLLVAERVTHMEQHAKETNGHIAGLIKEQFRQDGALSMLRWLSSVTLAGIGAGTAVAMVVLAIVARGM